MKFNPTLRCFDNKIPTVLKADGIYIFTKKGKVLDTTAGGTSYAVLGWNNKIVTKSLHNQLKKFCHIDYKIWEDPNVDKLSKKILSKAEHSLDKVYYCGNSGAEANEAAMKLSFLTHQANGKTKKKHFIGRLQSYHGMTTDALSVAERPNYNLFSVMHNKNRSLIPQHHYLNEKKKNETEKDYAVRSASYLEKEILRIGPDNVSAFIGETIMGGLVGDVEPVGNYWKLIRKICDKYDVHLILDECYCGLGSSGKIYCCDYDKITPDFITVAKCLTAGYVPLSAVVTKSEFDRKIKKKFGKILHSSTNQGHSLGIAAALAVQNLIHEKKTLMNINSQGNFMRDIIEDELKNHEFFHDVRGRGLRFSFEYKCENMNDFGTELSEIMLNKHKIFISGKFHRVCFTPAFIISRKESERVMDTFITEFKKTSKKKKYCSSFF
jgi:adenosylmethionine-8-amino-7-oxononanoate aminotransferase